MQPRPLLAPCFVWFFLAAAVAGCGSDDGETSPNDTADGGTTGGSSGSGGTGTGGSSAGTGGAAGSTVTGGSGGTSTGGSSGSGGSGASGGSGGSMIDAGPDGDASAPDPVQFELPHSGDEVLFSAAVRVTPPAEAVRVEVRPVGHPELTCVSDDFECLIDVSTLTGAFELEAIAFDDQDVELGSNVLPLTRRDVVNPCEGATSLTTCINDLATAGEAAGFAGVSYLNCDLGHATVNTSAYDGIDARELDGIGQTVPDGVEVGVANESRAYTLTGGWASIPRSNPAYGRMAGAVAHYEAGVYPFWPEHRDHGYRDYYMWQAPFYALSQGSSGTEKDEVEHLLHALGAMTSAARTAMRNAGAVGPALSMLLRRGRVETDLDYLLPEPHRTALTNETVRARIVTLAAAIRQDEIPPIARIESVTEDFSAWGTSMQKVLDTVYAVAWAPNTLPDPIPGGTFSIDVDLSATTDPSGREVLYFPALLRGDPGDVVIERANGTGTQWTISGSFPEDRTVNTSGQDRTLTRVTVVFFPHNGMWLGAPVYVSVGGRPAFDAAPNDNNLD